MDIVVMVNEICERCFVVCLLIVVIVVGVGVG